MWLYAQAWLPLITLTLAAALCFCVAVFMRSLREQRGWPSAPASFARPPKKLGPPGSKWLGSRYRSDR